MGSEIEPVRPAEYLGDERETFDRLDGETQQEYIWFRAYLKMGRKRSYRETSALMEVSRERVQAVAGKHSWVTRSNAYDLWIDQQRLAEVEGEAPAVLAKHSELLKKLSDKIEAGIDLFDPYKMNSRDLPAMVEVLLKYQRQNAGISDAAKKIEISGPGGNPIEVVNSLDVDQRRAMMAQLKAELISRLGEDIIEGEVEDAEVVEHAELGTAGDVGQTAQESPEQG